MSEPKKVGLFDATALSRACAEAAKPLQAWVNAFSVRAGTYWPEPERPLQDRVTNLRGVPRRRGGLGV